ncbi:Ribose-5-phosphate isomerase A [Methanoculleus chikugoensis]|jgi:ribose 5-phosphate isomerase A|uniref:Ribose-5-phosphate isomerase A n=1 Tax=Methanoculleus chikugoensis TaxID=118126 RepID=A0A1M4MMG0_9EURY|nr:ribose-5-phosphate isomerase RpiA [Methanoculleus chikugoensis]SCL76063.1 Ribose-5-phosphate isomerase A [Methanoculleus chikugoensis]
MSTAEQAVSKRNAGHRAAEEVADGMVVGLGTGSTVFFAMERLGERIAEDGLSIAGVPTSYQAAIRARRYGIPLASLDEHPELDIAIDGADQVDPALRLIKGRGAALLREKCVCDAARRAVIVVDGTKMVETLDAPVPVEVLPFAVETVSRRLTALGADPVLREGVKKDGPVVTDNGNFIVDCSFGTIRDPGRLETAIAAIPGALECGLFSAYTEKITVIVGEEKGCSVISLR